MSMFQIPLQMRKKRGGGGGGGEEGEEKEEEEELKAFAKMKKLNQYFSTSPGSTICRNTYNNWIDA